SITDNTDTGPSLAQTGTVTWTATGLAVPAYIEGVFLYFYHVSLDAGSASIYQITVDAPFQTCKDIWDGVYRECASFQADISDVLNDYSLEVLEESNIDYPICAQIGALDTTDRLILMFEDRCAAIRFEVLPQAGNTNAALMTIKYWNGLAYATVGTIYDGTLDAADLDTTISQTGVVSWNPPAETSEQLKTEFGITGYSYEITVDAQLSGT
ncbi:unnamed protein product, partial [marine sediment metagenome]